MGRKARKKRRTDKSDMPLEPLFQRVHEMLTHDLGCAHMRHLFSKRTRNRNPLINSGVTPYMFKKFCQLRDFDKRVIWADDKSFDELSEESLYGFIKSQSSFLLPEPMSQRSTRVITRAREICTEILGQFSYEEWFDSCSFGKRAAKNLPYAKSYLDIRMSRLSGTQMQWAAFNECLSRDIHLLRAVRKNKQPKKVVSSVDVTTVPKSWKAARVIAPDTILGGFLSRGLGAVIRARLEKNTRINLAKQQERHKAWSQVASSSGHLATIDMSKASDSFVWRHIEMLVPEDWHHALKCVRTSHAKAGEEYVDLNSYMLMGSGHTFPLQTLLFYCLAEATRTLLHSRGMVSVYGDDIIIPTRIADKFIVIMSELGFRINSEKSFFDEPDPERPSMTFFRESCGGDYKGGVDVRPYMPECDLQSSPLVPRNTYVAWCHRLINGLLDRWDVEEIETTVMFLLRSIANNCKAVCFVPHGEVDHAGIRHQLDQYYTYDLTIANIRFESSVVAYWALEFKQPKRPRSHEERSYLWYKYWQQRNANSARCPAPFIKCLIEEELKLVEDRSYASHVSLDGEARRDVEGHYRWVHKRPKEIPGAEK